MRSFLTIVSCAAITLWLGGLVALFLFVQVMFSEDRATAVLAAPVLFQSFEVYQLCLLAVSMAGMLAWRLVVCSTPKRWIMVMLMLAGTCAIVQTAFVSSRMRAIQASGQQDAGEFRRLHGYSMIIYTSQTVILAAAACLLPSAIRAEVPWQPRTFEQTAPA